MFAPHSAPVRFDIAGSSYSTVNALSSQSGILPQSGALSGLRGMFQQFGQMFRASSAPSASVHRAAMPVMAPENSMTESGSAQDLPVRRAGIPMQSQDLSVRRAGIPVQSQDLGPAQTSKVL